MSTSTLDRIRESLRLQQVYNLLLRYGWELGLERWPTINGFRHDLQAWVWRLPPDVDLDAVSTPAKVRMMLEELGPTYVKMGQIISSQSSVIPAEWNEELAKLQSSVPPFPTEEVREVIKEELGAYPEEIYKTFEPEAFAAASTAQVHRATLQDGTAVVVKVQRPGIRNQMRADIGIMTNAAGVLANRFRAVRAVDLPGMVDEFGTNVLRELDYRGEAYNAHVLGENLATIEGVHVPKIYYDLSTSKVLTMEFIKGVKISNLEAIEKARLDRQMLARNALRAMIKMLLIDGFFHADPHPGNILVNLETGTVNLLDTGMVGELDLSKRLTLIQLIMAFQSRDVSSMGMLLRDLSVPFMEPVDEKGFLKEFERTVNRYLLMENANLGFGQVVSEALDLLRKYGLRLDPNLTMAIKALMQAEAVSILLYPAGGISTDGATMIRELAMQAITADKVTEVAKKQLTLTAREALRQLPSLQDATLSWLKQYRKGRFEVYVDTSGLGQEINKLNRIGRLIVIGIVLAGMLIGSAVATLFLTQVTGENEAWQFIGRLAYLGYVFAMILAVIIVLRLMWEWWRGRDKV
jgi:ubiquinone biosynthesis protein